ncbi:MAG: PAS domain S-box protein [Deltaproteobacteria bacterium]|nr:PAS domain S-box protein [Deltaproteobacteria bacterium]
MNKLLRVLIIEDSEVDVARLVHTLNREGYEVVSKVVDTPTGMRAALESQDWDVIISDHTMPHFSAPEALALAKELRPSLPFIIVSEEIDLGLVVSLMKGGAHDYIQKRELSRVVPAVERELKEAESIIQRKQAEQALRKSGEYFRALIENSSDLIFTVDERGTITYGSPSVERILGYNHGELRGTNVFDLFTPEDRPRAISDFKMALLTKDVPIPNSFHIRHKNGKVLLLEGIGKNLLHNPAVASFVTNVRDVTDQKRAEEALRESEEKFRALSENAPDIIYTMNIEGVIMYVNPSWERILGHHQEEVLGRCFTDFVKEEDKDIYRKQLESIRDEEINIRNHIGVMLTKDGEERVFSMNDAFNRNIGGHIVGVVGSMHDVTNLIEIEKKLILSQKIESLGTLAGGIAHNFNNLLMGIQGYTSLVLLKTDPSHPSYEKLKRIEEQVQSGADLTRQLLGFAREGRYAVKPTDMNDVLEQSSSMFGKAKKEISVHRKYGKDLWRVEVDRGQMEQMLMSLYINAWQAMPGGGDIFLETKNMILDEKHSLLYPVKPGRYIKISVTDNGTGMDEKTRKRIFDPFFTTKEIGRGTGLGLASVYGIIKGHGGYIDVYSEPGHGTTFTIYIPAVEREPAKEEMTAETIAKGTGTILLVDDEKTILEVSKELLESMGYTIYAAGSGQEATTIYTDKKDEIDLIILDMIMPGISGGEAFDRLRAINSRVKVLLSSGYSITGQAQEILDRGCNGFIQKPFHPEELLSKIREMLG